MDVLNTLLSHTLFKLGLRTGDVVARIARYLEELELDEADALRTRNNILTRLAATERLTIKGFIELVTIIFYDQDMEFIDFFIKIKNVELHNKIPLGLIKREDYKECGRTFLHVIYTLANESLKVNKSKEKLLVRKFITDNPGAKKSSVEVSGSEGLTLIKLLKYLSVLGVTNIEIGVKINDETYSLSRKL